MKQAPPPEYRRRGCGAPGRPSACISPQEAGRLSLDHQREADHRSLPAGRSRSIIAQPERCMTPPGLPRTQEDRAVIGGGRRRAPAGRRMADAQYGGLFLPAELACRPEPSTHGGSRGCRAPRTGARPEDTHAPRAPLRALALLRCVTRKRTCSEDRNRTAGRTGSGVSEQPEAEASLNELRTASRRYTRGAAAPRRRPEDPARPVRHAVRGPRGPARQSQRTALQVESVNSATEELREGLSLTQSELGQVKAETATCESRSNATRPSLPLSSSSTGSPRSGSAGSATGRGCVLSLVAS